MSAGHGLVGNSGERGADYLLEASRNLKLSGTLVLNDGRGTLILQLTKGQVEASFKLGDYDRLDDVGQSFHLYPHEPAESPQLPARSPGSDSPLLRALPRTRQPYTLPTGVLDLSALLEQLHADSFDGVMAYVGNDETAVAVVLAGSIRAAVHERAGRLSSRSEALRVLQKRSSEKGEGRFELEAMERAIIGPLAALALESTAPTASDAPFSGLEMDERGYRFMRQGQAILCVPSKPHGPARRYALHDAQVPPPPLSFPKEPPGWEDRRYALTLRGKDALNPMTELNMEFRDHHGDIGQRVLDVLGRGHTLHDSADRLALDLGELKPWLERLEGAGLIREHRG
ncbi:MAG TPA: hypothetical protein VFD39_13250 [Trueperaceae bacterium]|nr:hypothetical protein [Trueperaceae bacterium]